VQDPRSVVFYASGRASLETSYMWALLARLYGNNNLPDSSNMCHEPTSVALPQSIGAPVEPFAVAVVFAANCSFASPVGYQTNLLVMGPGRYKFFDFVRVGMPLIFLLWITFSLFAPWYYGF